MRVFEISYAYRGINASPNLVNYSTKETTIVVAEDMNEAAYEFFTDIRLDRMILNDVEIVERKCALIQAPVFEGENAIGDKANYVRERAMVPAIREAAKAKDEEPGSRCRPADAEPAVSDIDAAHRARAAGVIG